MRKSFFLAIGIAIFPYLLIAQTTNWSSLGLSFDYEINKVYSDSPSGQLFIGGYFHNVNGRPSSLVSWDGTNAKLFPLFPYTGLDGFYNYKGTLMMYGLARNSAILSLKDTNLEVFQSLRNGAGWLSEFEGKLVIAGNFGSIAGVKAYGIAMWDGRSWSDFNRMDTLLVDSTWNCGGPIKYKGQYYIYGNINPHNKPLISEIARFDGQHWRDVGGGIQPGGLTSAQDALVWHGDLYVGGEFTESDGGPGNAIARWDGTSWHRLGDGLSQGHADPFITCMVIYHDNLYVAGAFTSAGGVPASMIARWDGEKWCSLGGRFNNVISSMAVYKDELYVAGGFTSIDGDYSYNRIAKWTGGDYVAECGPASPTSVIAPKQTQIQINPNPASSELTVSARVTGEVFIVDATGKCMARARSSSNAPVSFNISAWPAGVYFVQFRSGTEHAGVRFVKQ